MRKNINQTKEAREIQEDISMAENRKWLLIVMFGEEDMFIMNYSIFIMGVYIKNGIKCDSNTMEYQEQEY